MQVSLIPNHVYTTPKTETEKMECLFNEIDKQLEKIPSRRASSDICNSIVSAVKELIALVDRIDNANDFYKIGGFSILAPLLSMEDPLIKSVTAELIGVLVQNNSYCQEKILEKKNVIDKLLQILKGYELALNYPSHVKVKALFAISCLVRSSHKIFCYIEELDGVPLFLDLLQSDNSKLKMKASFLLAYLVNNEPTVCEILYTMNFLPTLINLIDDSADDNQEYMLLILLSQIQQHDASKKFCCNHSYLKGVLENKIKFHGHLAENHELTDYCKQLLTLCFLRS